MEGGGLGVGWSGHLISVAPALTLMAAWFGPSAISDLFQLDTFFSLPLCSRRKREGAKKSILGSTPWHGHHFRIEMAVSHCHLVTFVRHCTFKPSFFSPSSSLHSLLARAHCLNSPGGVLCCNLKTRGQEIKCEGFSLKPIGGPALCRLLFSDPHPPSSFHPLVSADLHCVAARIYL